MYALLLGTSCTSVHIVPVAVNTNDASITLDDLDLSHWLNITRLQPTWVNLEQRRHRFKGFSRDDAVPRHIQYVTCFEEQPTRPLSGLDVNEYVRSLKGNFGQCWYGNMLVFKLDGDRRVVNFTPEDEVIGQRCAAMYATFMFYSMRNYSQPISSSESF